MKKPGKDFSRGFRCGIAACEQAVDEKLPDLLECFTDEHDKQVAAQVAGNFKSAFAGARVQIAALTELLEGS